MESVSPVSPPADEGISPLIPARDGNLVIGRHPMESPPDYAERRRADFKVEFRTFIETAREEAKKLTDDGLPQGVAWQYVMDILKLSRGHY